MNGTHTTNGVNGVNGVNRPQDDHVELWRHPHPETTEFYAFQQHLRKKYNIKSNAYSDLWQWSIDHPSAFWEEVWHYTGIKAHKHYDSVIDNDNYTTYQALQELIVYLRY